MFAVQCPPSCHFITTKMASREQNYFPNLKKTNMDRSSTEFWFLLQSLSFPLRPLFISHWGGPSCWSPLQKQAPPPWAGRTATTHSNRSYRRDREARGRRLHREHRGVPSVHHDRLYRKPVDRVHLEGVKEKILVICEKNGT